MKKLLGLLIIFTILTINIAYGYNYNLEIIGYTSNGYPEYSNPLEAFNNSDPNFLKVYDYAYLSYAYVKIFHNIIVDGDTKWLVSNFEPSNNLYFENYNSLEENNINEIAQGGIVFYIAYPLILVKDNTLTFAFTLNIDLYIYSLSKDLIYSYLGSYLEVHIPYWVGGFYTKISYNYTIITMGSNDYKVNIKAYFFKSFYVTRENGFYNFGPIYNSNGRGNAYNIEGITTSPYLEVNTPKSVSGLYIYKLKGFINVINCYSLIKKEETSEKYLLFKDIDSPFNNNISIINGLVKGKYIIFSKSAIIDSKIMTSKNLYLYSSNEVTIYLVYYRLSETSAYISNTYRTFKGYTTINLGGLAIIFYISLISNTFEPTFIKLGTDLTLNNFREGKAFIANAYGLLKPNNTYSLLINSNNNYNGVFPYNSSLDLSTLGYLTISSSLNSTKASTLNLNVYSFIGNIYLNVLIPYISIYNGAMAIDLYSPPFNIYNINSGNYSLRVYISKALLYINGTLNKTITNYNLNSTYRYLSLNNNLDPSKSYDFTIIYNCTYIITKNGSIEYIGNLENTYTFSYSSYGVKSDTTLGTFNSNAFSDISVRANSIEYYITYNSTGSSYNINLLINLPGFSIVNTNFLVNKITNSKLYETTLNLYNYKININGKIITLVGSYFFIISNSTLYAIGLKYNRYFNLDIKAFNLGTNYIRGDFYLAFSFYSNYIKTQILINFYYAQGIRLNIISLVTLILKVTLASLSLIIAIALINLMFSIIGLPYNIIIAIISGRDPKEALREGYKTMMDTLDLLVVFYNLLVNIAGILLSLVSLLGAFLSSLGEVLGYIKEFIGGTTERVSNFYNSFREKVDNGINKLKNIF